MEYELWLVHAGEKNGRDVIRCSGWCILSVGDLEHSDGICNDDGLCTCKMDIRDAWKEQLWYGRHDRGVN